MAMLTPPRFDLYAKVYSRAPTFFHGEVRGWYVNNDFKWVYVVRTNGGNFMFVEDENLLPSKGDKTIPGSNGKG